MYWSLNFRKPFCDPNNWLEKKLLQFYIIRDNTVNWIQNWLTGRTQCVIVDAENPTESPVKVGVPQGIVLGPLMFIMYINNIGKFTSSGIWLFADDCLLSRKSMGRQILEIPKGTCFSCVAVPKKDICNKEESEPQVPVFHPWQDPEGRWTPPMPRPWTWPRPKLQTAHKLDHLHG